MRKQLFSMVFGAIIALTSCQQEKLEVDNPGVEVNVSMTALLENEIRSKATSPYDQVDISRYVMEVYLVDGDQETAYIANTQQESSSFTFRLMSGKTYKFYFWADNGSGYYDANDLSAVKSNAHRVGNDKKRDAFCGSETFAVTGNLTQTVMLKRPFAQVNVATAVFEQPIDRLNLTHVKVKYTTKLYTTFNVKNKEVGGDVEVEWNALADIQKASPVQQTLGTSYVDLSTDYLFAPTGGTIIDFAMVFYNGENEITTNQRFTTIPIKPNYRTNIIGDLVTKEDEIKVNIEPDYLAD